MIVRSFLVLAFYLLAAQASVANGNETEFEDIDKLRAKIDTHAHSVFREIYGEEKFSRDVKIKVSRLDPRLHLGKCEYDLQFELVKPAHRSRNATVKTACGGPRRWSIYVPISIEVFADVVVASRDLARGTILADADLEYRRMNTSLLPLGHVEDDSRLIGMELRRAARGGDHFLMSAVAKPRVINKGDSVVLEARSSSLMVATKGTALNNGQVGEQIKVRNNRSERVLDATVVGPGRVSVVSR